MQRNHEKNIHVKHGSEHERLYRNHVETKKPAKNLIFLKSTVIALFIVLVVMMIALLVVKAKRHKNSVDIASECSQAKTIVTSKNVSQMQLQGNVITILTNFDKETGKQEIIRIDAACGNEINRVILDIKDKKEITSDNDQF